MAVVKNLMIRIGADYSGARKAMQGATRDLGRFKRDTTRTTASIKGKSGLGGVSTEFKNLGSMVTSSLSRIRGAKGISGVAGELKTLRPLLGTASRGLGSLGGAAVGAGAAFGGATLAITGFVAILAIATSGIYAASQAAVKYEADLGRLNMQLKGGTREYMNWARAQGLSKTSAVEMGATYSTILSSFIQDSRQLQTETARLVHASRVVASATGRSITDVTERMRSGLLGNTESIEDLGVFVNVSMIESTEAFRKFAGDKSWNQLDFLMQQQIRLAAILEQSYKRYGNELQNKVMTKQEQLMEQLRDIKLNFSQAFLPIWDSVLPTLQMLARDVAFVTEKIARLMYTLRGWDYDEMTQGIDQQTGATENLGDSLGETEKSAKKAYKALASFDNLNLIGESGGSGGNGSSGAGSTGGAGGSGLPGGGLSSSDGPNLPQYPPLNMKRWRLEFDTPRPPDAGAGAVATAVTSTMNALIAETKAKNAQMWADLNEQGLQGSLAQRALWAGMAAGIASGTVPVMVAAVNLSWANMWSQMLAQAQVNAPSINAQIEMLKLKILSITTPLVTIKESWRSTLNDMQSKLNSYRPYLEWGFTLIGKSVLGLANPLADAKQSWSDTLSDMYTTAATKLGGIVSLISGVVSAWSSMKQVLTGAAAKPAPSPQTSVGTDQKPSFIQQQKDMLKYSFSSDGFSNLFDFLKKEANNPVNQAAIGVLGAVVPAGKAAPILKGAASKLGEAIKALSSLFKGGGVSIPAFANGAVVYGPTMAMVGDNRNASVDPEVIAPLSMLQSVIGGDDNSDVVAVLRQIYQAVRENKTVRAVIEKDAVGRAAVDFINDESRRGRNPLPNL